MINPKTVYVKTAKGQEEIDKRTHKLPLKLRSLLIMINGKVTAGEIIEYGGSFGGGMDVLLAQLVEGGFVEPAQAVVAPVPAPAVAVGASSPATYDEKIALQAAKNAIKKMVYDQLGPDGEMVVAKLEKCESRLQLVTYCDTCKDIVEAALGKSKGQALWAKAKEAVETAFAGADGQPPAATPIPAQPVPTPAATVPPSAPPPVAAAAPAASAPTASSVQQPKREVEKWMFEKVRGEISRLVFDSLGPDGEMMAMKIEGSKSMGEIRAQGEMIFEVVRGVRGKQRAIEIKARIEGLIAAVEGGG